MPAPSFTDPSALQSLQQQFRAASPRLAAACEQVGAAMRGRFVRLAAALEDADAPAVAGIVDELRESELVTGLAGKLHDLRDKAHALFDALAPWAKVIAGLVVGIGAYFAAAELGLVLTALLMIGGFLYAIVNALDVIHRQSLRALAD